ncbi:hypothetical protein AVEN_193084-1 [Araneus ventricosus]|uniref:Uncharacterized protein n=1 Tax=Araneus ventricosus TaxID=182803 RepID=A0A4Y2B3J1_ARAVE|nr:hypothetical protein AVEN_193084-1 [Araneus ventricosus]
MIVESIVSSVNQSLEIGIEEIRVQFAEPLDDVFLNLGIGSEMATYQVLLQGSDEMKIPWCEIRDVVVVLSRPDLCSSRISVLPSSNSLLRNHTCFCDITFPQ